MADERMIFGAGFSFDGADDDLVKQWQVLAPKVEKKLKPLTIDLNIKELDLTSLDDVRKRLQSIKLEPITPETRSAVNSLVKELKTLEAVLVRLDKYNTQLSKSAQSRATSSSLEAQRAARTAEINERASLRQADADRKAARDAELLRAQKARAEQAELRLAAAKEKTINATNRQNVAYQSQASYIGRLVERMALYFSIAQGLSFVRQIREVTAEFELQRVSLGALIQDTEKANKLFEQIKIAAVESPFQIKELVTYTKQLAAYRIEQEKLFEWTQRLADVSAGLGVDMSRLILAFGQVRATTYLRGSEVRQFTEAGIPIVEALAEKFSKLRGEMVTTAEVFGLISKKAVSFSMVEDIFEDMTNAGGMFYQMQAKQAKSLAGQWSNLIDVMNIAQSEMGEEWRGEIEATISTVKYLWENWKDVAKVIQVVSAGLGTYLLITKNAAIASKAMTAADAMDFALKKANVAYLKKLNPLTMAYTVNLNALTFSKRLYVIATAKAAAATGFFTKAIWAMTAALLKNPITLIVAGLVAAGVALYKFKVQAKDISEEIDELTDSMASLSTFNKKSKNLDSLITQYEELSSKLNKTQDEMKKLKTISQELASQYPSAVQGVDNLTGAYVLLIDKINELNSIERKELERSTTNELNNIERLIAELSAEREELSKVLSKGTQISSVYRNIGGIPQKVREEEVPLSDSDREKYFQRIQEIVKQLEDLGVSAKNAREILANLTPDNSEMESQFSGWRKTISDFKLELEDGSKISFFDDEQISRFKDLNDALGVVAKGYDSAKEELSNYQSILRDNTKLTKEERAEINGSVSSLEKEQSIRRQILEHYQSLNLLKKEKVDTDNTPIKALDAELSLIQEVFKKYKEYAEYRTATESKSAISDIYGKSLTDAGLNVSELDFSDSQLKDLLSKIQKKYEALGESEKALKLGLEIDNIAFEKAKRDLENKISSLQSEIDRSKLRKNLFNNLLGITGDEDLATTLTISVYGEIEGDLPKTLAERLRENTNKQLEEAFKGIDISQYLSPENIDYAGLDKLIKDLGDAIPEAQREQAGELVTSGLSEQAKDIEELVKSLDLYRSYENQRSSLMSEGLAERKKINGLSIKEEEKQLLIEASFAKERKALLDLDIKNIKDFQLAFSNTDLLSNKTLKKNLDVLNFALKGITDPEQIKLFKDQIEEIEEALLDAFSQPIDTDLNSIVGSFRRQLYYQDKINKAKQDGLDVSQEDIDAQIKYTEKIKEGLALSGVNVFISGLQKSSELMKEIAELSGDVELAELGEELGALSQNLGAAAQGAASSGSWVGAVIGGGMDMINQTVEAFTNAKLEAAEATSNAVDYANALELANLVIDESRYNDVFGSSSIAMAADAYGKGLDALSKYNEAVGAATKNMPELEKELTSMGSAVFLSAVPFAFLKKETNESLASLDAFKKGYNELQSILIKTTDKSGWANFWGDQDEYTALGDLAPEIWQDGIFNIDNAQAFLDTNTQVSEEQRKQIQNVIDLHSQYEELMSVVDEQINENFGSLSSDLADVIWNSVANGTDAWADFKSVGSEAIAALGKQMLQEFILTTFLEQYRDDMRAAFAQEDPAIAMRDVVDNIFQGMGGMISTSEAVAKEWQDWMAENGYNITDTTSGLQGISKEFANASESAILGLAHAYNTNNFYTARMDANIAAIRLILETKYGITTDSSMGLTSQQDMYLSNLPKIEINTSQTVEECKNIVRETKRVADTLDSAIRPLGTPASKAIKTM